MIEVVQVRLREQGKTLFFNARGIKYNVGDYVLLEADRGIDYGEVISNSTVLDQKGLDSPVKAIIRKVDKQDNVKIKQGKEKARDAHKLCNSKIAEHKLDMKLVSAEYSFDQSKLIVYFTSEGRVDFRKLVKDLASVFKVRIELRQIGVRDEAKMLGGCGHCGQPLCCAQFLKDFEPVTIKMAKEQRLSLNPTKISGVCGRLMCCLGYEYKTYMELVKNFPEIGQVIKVKDDVVRVCKVDVLRQRLKVEYETGAIKDVAFEDCSCSQEGCKLHNKVTAFKKKKKKAKRREIDNSKGPEKQENKKRSNQRFNKDKNPNRLKDRKKKRNDKSDGK